MRKIVLLAAIAVMLAGCGGSANPGNGSKEPEKGPEQQHGGPNPEPEPETRPHLPGLGADYAITNLKEMGLRCDLAEFVEPRDDVCWHCEDLGTTELLVDVWGYGRTAEVYAVQAMFINLAAKDTDAVAVDRLAHIAAIPYKGSSPEQASSWVESNIGTDALTRFGDVNFTLHAEGEVRMLDIQASGAKVRGRTDW